MNDIYIYFLFFFAILLQLSNYSMFILTIHCLWLISNRAHQCWKWVAITTSLQVTHIFFTTAPSSADCDVAHIWWSRILCRSIQHKCQQIFILSYYIISQSLQTNGCCPVLIDLTKFRIVNISLWTMKIKLLGNG